MSEQHPHLKTLEKIERSCVPGLVEVLRTEGLEEGPEGFYRSSLG
jgi:hypothetical protein